MAEGSNQFNLNVTAPARVPLTSQGIKGSKTNYKRKSTARTAFNYLENQTFLYYCN